MFVNVLLGICLSICPVSAYLDLTMFFRVNMIDLLFTTKCSNRKNTMRPAKTPWIPDDPSPELNNAPALPPFLSTAF